jgi:hypothetical protein
MDTTSADVTLILYVKPDRTQGTWTAIPVSNTLVYYFSNGDIDQSGNWQFQAYLEIGGRKTYGDIVTKTFVDPLNLVITP